MKKRVITIVLSLMMIFSCLPTALADDTPQGTSSQLTETSVPMPAPEPTDETTEQQSVGEAYTVSATLGDYDYSVNADGISATITGIMEQLQMWRYRRQ